MVEVAVEMSTVDAVEAFDGHKIVVTIVLQHLMGTLSSGGVEETKSIWLSKDVGRYLVSVSDIVLAFLRALMVVGRGIFQFPCKSVVSLTICGEVSISKQLINIRYEQNITRFVKRR